MIEELLASQEYFSGNIVVASQSAVKLDAIRRVFPGAKVSGEVSNSGIPEQPFGLTEIQKGAQNRFGSIQSARETNDLAVAIENGIARGAELAERKIVSDASGFSIIADQWYDVACVLIQSREGKQAEAISGAVCIPSEVVDQALQYQDRSVTVGKILAEQHPEVPHQDPHQFLTKGKTNRVQLLADAIEQAVQILAAN